MSRSDKAPVLIQGKISTYPIPPPRSHPHQVNPNGPTIIQHGRKTCKLRLANRGAEVNPGTYFRLANRIPEMNPHPSINNSRSGVRVGFLYDELIELY